METVARHSYGTDPDTTFDILQDVIHESYRVKRIDNRVRTIEFSSGMSLFSFGENFEAIVAGQGKGSMVKLRAKSKIKWNVTANNKNIVARIFESLDEKLHSHDPSKD